MSPIYTTSFHPGCSDASTCGAGRVLPSASVEASLERIASTNGNGRVEELCSGQIVAPNTVGISKSQPIKQWKGIEEYVLNNGMKVILCPNGGKTFQASLIINAGSTSDPIGQKGIAHFVEHLVGGQQFQGANMLDVCEYLGGNFDICTNSRATVYGFELLYEHADIALDLLAKVFKKNGFSKSELKSELGAILSEMKSMEQRDSANELSRSELMYPKNHPLRSSIKGSEADLENIGVPQCEDFYRENYIPSKSILLISAPCDSTELLGKVKTNFEAIPAGKYSPPPAEAVKKQTQQKIKTIKDSHESGIVIGYHIPGGLSQDNHDLNLLAEFLECELNNLYCDKFPDLAGQLSFSVFTDENAHDGIFFINGDADDQLKKKDLNLVRDWILSVIDKIVSTGVVGNYRGPYYGNQPPQEFKILAGEHGRYNWVYDATINQIDWFPYKEFLVGRDLESADIKRLAGKYLRPEQSSAVIYLAGREDGSGKTSTQEESLVAAELPDLETRLPRIPDYLTGRDNLLANTEGLAKIVFDQGPKDSQLRVIHDKSSNLIKFRLSNLGGDRLDHGGKFGLSHLTSKLLNEAGTKNSDHDEILKQQTAMTSFFMHCSGENDHGVYFHCPADKLDEFLKHLNEILTEPKLSPDISDEDRVQLNKKLEAEKQLLISELENDECGDLIERPYQELCRTLYPADHYFHKKPIDQLKCDIESITLDDVIDFYESNYKIQGNDTKITSIGALSLGDLKSKVLPLFESWHFNDKPKYKLPEIEFQVTEKPQRKIKLNIENVDLSSISMGNTWKMDMDLDKLKPILRLVYLLVRDRLYKLFREHLSLVYGVEVRFNNHKEILEPFGDFFVNLEVPSKLIKPVRKLLIKALQGLLTGGITSNELKLWQVQLINKSKLQYLRQALKSDEEVGTLDDENIDSVQENQISPYLLQNSSLDFARERQEILSLSLEDVNSALKQLIKPNEFVTIMSAQPVLLS